MNIENKYASLVAWGVSAGALITYLFSKLLFEMAQHRPFRDDDASGGLKILLPVAVAAAAVAVFFQADKKLSLLDGMNWGRSPFEDLWDTVIFLASLAATLAAIEVVAWAM